MSLSWVVQGPADYKTVDITPKETASLDDLRKRFTRAKSKCVSCCCEYGWSPGAVQHPDSE
jgi:hypothetical protein